MALTTPLLLIPVAAAMARTVVVCVIEMEPV